MEISLFLSWAGLVLYDVVIVSMMLFAVTPTVSYKYVFCFFFVILPVACVDQANPNPQTQETTLLPSKVYVLFLVFLSSLLFFILFEIYITNPPLQN